MIASYAVMWRYRIPFVVITVESIIPRPAKIVKNDLSLAIVDLRRRLGLSQQSWSNLLGLSIGAVARWELNQRPERNLLKRLMNLADDAGYRDLTEVFYSAYRREFGLEYDMAAATESCADLAIAIQLVEAFHTRKTGRGKLEDETGKEFILEKLRAVFKRISEFPTDPHEFKKDEPQK